MKLPTSAKLFGDARDAPPWVALVVLQLSVVDFTRRDRSRGGCEGVDHGVRRTKTRVAGILDVRARPHTQLGFDEHVIISGRLHIDPSRFLLRAPIIGAARQRDGGAGEVEGLKFVMVMEREAPQPTVEFVKGHVVAALTHGTRTFTTAVRSRRGRRARSARSAALYRGPERYLAVRGRSQVDGPA